MAEKRIYLVQNTITESSVKVQSTRRLIEASTQAEAIRRVVADSITCAVATPMELVACTKDGVEIEMVPATKMPNLLF